MRTPVRQNRTAILDARSAPRRGEPPLRRINPPSPPEFKYGAFWPRFWFQAERLDKNRTRCSRATDARSARRRRRLSIPVRSANSFNLLRRWQAYPCTGVEYSCKTKAICAAECASMTIHRLRPHTRYAVPHTIPMIDVFSDRCFASTIAHCA